MPGAFTNPTIHIGPHSSIEQMNEVELSRAGELGTNYMAPTNKWYRVAQLDSGATASAAPGAVVAGDVAFWKNKTGYIVTNDLAQAAATESTNQNSKRNMVAGVFTAAVTAGRICAIQFKGRHAAVKSDGGGDFVVGDLVIAKNTTVADVDRMAAGTAPTHIPLGIVAAAESGGFVAVDLDLPLVP